MKVFFKDIEFGAYEPHWNIELDGKKFKVIDIDIITDDGAEETHRIADHALEEYLFSHAADGKLTDDDQFLDDSISYYAEPNDGLWFVLEQITGEEAHYCDPHQAMPLDFSMVNML